MKAAHSLLIVSALALLTSSAAQAQAQAQAKGQIKATAASTNELISPLLEVRKLYEEGRKLMEQEKKLREAATKLGKEAKDLQAKFDKAETDFKSLDAALRAEWGMGMDEMLVAEGMTLQKRKKLADAKKNWETKKSAVEKARNDRDTKNTNLGNKIGEVKSVRGEAIAKLRVLWARNRSFDVASNLGNAYDLFNDKPGDTSGEELKDELYNKLEWKKAEAAEAYDFAIRNWKLSTKPGEKDDDYLRIAARLKALKGELVTISVTVTGPGSAPLDGASIFVNGAEVGRSPLDHDLFFNPDGDAATIEVRLSGYTISTETLKKEDLSSKKGASLPKSIQLKPLPPPVGEVIERPASSAGDPVGRPPRKGAASPHVVAVKPEAALDPGFEDNLLKTGGITAGVFLVTGAVLAGLYVKTGDDAAALRDGIVRTPSRCAGQEAACQAVQDKLIMKDTLGYATIGAFGAAGIVGALTGVLWGMSRPASGSKKAAFLLLPTVAPGAGGAVVRGTW